MEPTELFMWRHEHGMSQTALAKALGLKQRQTVAQWEKGLSRMPVGLKTMLAMITTAKREAEAPEFISMVAAKLRPDLNLFVRWGKHTIRGPEHPGKLLAQYRLLVVDPDHPQAPIPWSVLVSAEYQAALHAYRTRPKKPTHGVPSALSTMMDNAIKRED